MSFHLPAQNRLAPPPLPPHWIRYNRTFYASIHVFVNEDLSSVFILDNSPGAYQYNPGKAVGT